MWFIVVGVLLVALKLADIAPVAGWLWWWVLAPFPLAAVWWAIADSTGMTKRNEMNKLEDKKKERRRRSMEAMGLDRESQKRQQSAEGGRRVAANRAEAQRTEKRDKNEKIVRDSVFDNSQQSSGFDDSMDGKSKKR